MKRFAFFEGQVGNPRAVHQTQPQNPWVMPNPENHADGCTTQTKTHSGGAEIRKEGKKKKACIKKKQKGKTKTQR